MSVTTRWWWIRHAPVTTDGGKIYGQSDVPADCSETGIFEALGRVLPPDAIWITSQLMRTRQTAEAIRDGGGRFDDLMVAEDFAEQHFGEWQGRNRKKIFENYGADHGFWLAPAHHAPPGGESFVDLMRRVGTAVDRFNREHAGRDIVAVAHGGTIRAAIGHALGLPPERAIGFVIDNCSLSRLDHIAAGDKPGVWRICSINEMLHRN